MADEEKSTHVTKPSEKKRVRRRVRLLARQERANLLVVLGTREGRAFIWDLLVRSGVFALSFSGEQPLTMAFNEGRRQYGNRLLAEINQAAPEAYLLMLKEANGETQ